MGLWFEGVPWGSLDEGSRKRDCNISFFRREGEERLRLNKHSANLNVLIALKEIRD